MTVDFDYLPGSPGICRFLLAFVMIGFFTIENSVSQTESGKLNHNVHYVSVDGDDSLEGTFDLPWASVERALTKTGPGDVVLLRGGTYNITNAVQLGGAQGEEDRWITVKSYPGEQAVFDASGFVETDDGQTPH